MRSKENSRSNRGSGTMNVEYAASSPRIALIGAGNGPLVLFMHGIGGGKENWIEQIPAFAPEFQAVAWDARGYGNSDDYEGPCRFEDFAADVVRVIDFYGAQKAHLIGLSMGGRIAQHCYFRTPDRVASLTLCDTQMTFENRSDADREAFLASRRAPLLAGKTPRDIAPAVINSLVAPNAPKRARDQAMETMGQLRTENYLKTMEAVLSEPIAGDFTKIDVPVHVVVGELDKMTPPAISEDIARRIPGARFSVIPGAGHLSNIEEPEAFNRAALEFVRDVDQNRR